MEFLNFEAGEGNKQAGHRIYIVVDGRIVLGRGASGFGIDLSQVGGEGRSRNCATSIA
jgi:hypothetical protein